MDNQILKIKRKETAEQERDKALAIITHFVDGLLFFNQTNQLSLMNLRAEKMFNVKKEDLLGRHIAEFIRTPVFKFLKDFLEGEIKTLFKREKEFKKNLILEISVIPVVIKKENLGLLVIFHDITREKRVERMKSEFVTLAAHQLRTPLSGIKWSLKMILDGEVGKLTQDQTSFLSKAYHSNERMIGLITDLLNVAKIEEGKHIFNPVLTEIEPIIQFVVNSYKEKVKNKRLKIEFQRPKKILPRIKVDVGKIRLAVQNLLDNAIKYTLPGGKVIISLKQVNMGIKCAVEDTGVGIFQEEQDRVFSKFFRGSNVVRMETEGSGLGLFIAKNIVEAHKGKIGFTSEPNKGSVFYFTLPIK
jgi:two-component system phosphate regulon sensor histidine kinase PhoR